MTYRRLLFAAFFSLLASARLIHAGVTATADDLLNLKEQNAEAVETLDMEMQSDIEANGRTSTSHTRLMVDKTQGAMRFQRFDGQGAVHSEVMVVGTQAYFHTSAGTWNALPMDDQTKDTLISMGVPLEAPQSGLGGHEKMNHSAARDGQGLRSLDAAAHRRIASRIARMKLHLRFDRRPEMDDEAHHLRAISRRPGAGAKNMPYDEEIEKIDENTGLSMEKGRWIDVERYPGGKDKVPAGINHRRSDDGKDLVEFQHHQVTKVMMVKGLAMPQEVQAVHYTATKRVNRHMKWLKCKVNEGFDPDTFKRK
jgi:hypothetical protein